MRGASYNKVHEFYESPSRSYGALQTLGAGSILKGLVFPALNKLLNIKADLVKTDEGWEELFTQKGVGTNIPLGLHCIFGCRLSRGGRDSYPVYDTLEKRYLFFSKHRPCFNCERQGHGENKCRGRGCYKCKARHHISLCKNEQKNEDRNNRKMLTEFLPSKK